jgi:hypothetical protein
MRTRVSLSLVSLLLAGCTGSGDAKVTIHGQGPPLGPLCLVVDNTPLALSGCTPTRPATTITPTPTPTPENGARQTLGG